MRLRRVTCRPRFRAIRSKIELSDRSFFENDVRTENRDRHGTWRSHHKQLQMRLALRLELTGSRRLQHETRALSKPLSLDARKWEHGVRGAIQRNSCSHHEVIGAGPSAGQVFAAAPVRALVPQFVAQTTSFTLRFRDAVQTKALPLPDTTLDRPDTERICAVMDAIRELISASLSARVLRRISHSASRRFLRPTLSSCS